MMTAWTLEAMQDRHAALVREADRERQVRAAARERALRRPNQRAARA